MISVGGRWKELTGGISTAVRRFPLSLAAGVVGTCAGIAFMRGRLYEGDYRVALRLLLTAWLGVALFLTAALVGARLGERGSVRRWIPSLAAAALLAACYAALGGHDEWQVIRFALFLLAAHALLALAPLALSRRGDFRPFNLMLFSRTALALLLTHVLFAGLCFARAALEHLFDLGVSDRFYGDLWFVLLGVFNTAYVLAGIPDDWDQLEGRFPTPRPLDVLARHVLLPLSLLYLAILYVYSAKIIVVHQWPRGWVSAPIIVFAAVGLLTVLLLEPGRLAASRVARAYTRGFFVALLPLVVLLFLAISRRTLEYGLTEERCLVYAIAVFLALLAPYFVLSRTRNLAAIPLTLAAIAVATAVGPFSARSLALRSQTARLRGLLEHNDRLVHGVLARSSHEASQRDEHEIGAALSYLESRHALGPVLAWRPSTAACSGCDALATAKTGHDIAIALGLRYRPWRSYEGELTTVQIMAPTPDALETSGFDVVFPSLNCWFHDAPCRSGKQETDWIVRVEGTTLIIDRGRQAITRIPLGDLEPVAKAGDEQVMRESPLIREGRWDSGRYRFFISSITFNEREEDRPAQITVLSGVLLLALGH